MSSSAPIPPSPTAKVASEDILSAKTDLCVSNAIVKTGIAFGVGVVSSAILFRRRQWPVFVGIGFGLGQSYSDCERVFNPAAVPGFTIAGQTPGSSSADLTPLKLQFKAQASQAAAAVSDLKDKVVGKAEVVKAEVKEGAKEVKEEVKKAEDLLKGDKKIV
ncbi:DUF543-domain-containing protein [Meredithblackwellia eburnea MCA 4105]